MIERIEKIWDRILDRKPRKFKDEAQKRLEVEMARAEIFCFLLTEHPEGLEE